MRFATPWFLLLLLVPVLRLWLRRRNDRRRDGAVAWVSAGVLEGLPRTARSRMAPLPRWLEFAGATILIQSGKFPICESLQSEMTNGQ